MRTETAFLFLTFCFVFVVVDAWTPRSSTLSRRAVLSQTTVGGMLLWTTPAPVLVVNSAPAFASNVDTTSSTAALLEELKASQVKLEAIPDLLEQKEWDKVRSILKVPPVNKLWNLGDVRRNSSLYTRYNGAPGL